MENEFAVGMDNLVKTDQKFNKKTKFLVEMAKSVEIDRFDQWIWSTMGKMGKKIRQRWTGFS